MAKRAYTSLPFTEYATTAFDSEKYRNQITQVIIHSTVCTTQQAINTFSSPNAQTSAHYIIGNDGSLHAGLEEFNVAFHAGNYAVNQSSIGIEHEWYVGIHPSDALYQTSAKLVADICKFYNIPCDRIHIRGHKEVVPTGCPNQINVDKIANDALLILQGNPMNQNIIHKSGSFDRIWHAFKGDQVDTDKVTDQEVTDFIAWVKSNVDRAGRWDQLVTKAFGGGTNSSATSVQQLYDKIKALGGDISALKTKIINFVNTA